MFWDTATALLSVWNSPNPLELFGKQIDRGQAVPLDPYYGSRKAAVFTRVIRAVYTPIAKYGV